MDDTLVDYAKGFDRHKEKYPDLEFPQAQPGLYLSLEPKALALDTLFWIDKHPSFVVYILTAPSIRNPHTSGEKHQWILDNLGRSFAERMIISSNKGLCKGAYLIDDYDHGKGQENFEGNIIKFGSAEFPDWKAIKTYFTEDLHEKR